jgi:hypothetical protein
MALHSSISIVHSGIHIFLYIQGFATHMVNGREVMYGAVFLIASAGNFFIYNSKPYMPEMDLIKGASAYIQQYDGDKPSDAIVFAKQTLDIAARKNPDIKGISDLEKEISLINLDQGNTANPVIYKPVLKSVGDKMELIADKNPRQEWDLYFSFFAAGMGFAILSGSIRR